MSAIIEKAKRTTMYSLMEWFSRLTIVQLASHRIIGPNYLTQSFLQTEQSNLDQDDVQIVGHDPRLYNATIKVIQCSNTRQYNGTQGDTMP